MLTSRDVIGPSIHRIARVVRVGLLLVLLAWPETCRAELVGWWTFDGDVLDHSGKGNDGTLFGAVYDDRHPAATGSGQSINFSANSHRVRVKANPSLNSNIFTLSMFLFDRGQCCAFERLTSRQNDSFETAINVYPDANGSSQLSFFSPASAWVTSEYTPNLEQWTHVAYVADGQQMTIFGDGKQVGDPMPFTATPTGYMYIGSRTLGGEAFDGLIDDVALWNEVLPPERIQMLANGKWRPEPPRPAVAGDFNRNQLLDVEDLDMLTNQALAGTNPLTYDLNNDSLVNSADRESWIVSLKKTYYGDSNLDGVFNSGDLVQVFSRGEYEDLLGENSSWASGDWNGDLEFNSSDLVTAFQGGGYEASPRAATASIPEPNTLGLLAGGVAMLAKRWRRNVKAVVSP